MAEGGRYRRSVYIRVLLILQFGCYHSIIMNERTPPPRSWETQKGSATQESDLIPLACVPSLISSVIHDTRRDKVAPWPDVSGQSECFPLCLRLFVCAMVHRESGCGCCFGSGSWPSNVMGRGPIALVSLQPRHGLASSGTWRPQR